MGMEGVEEEEDDCVLLVELWKRGWEQYPEMPVQPSSLSQATLSLQRIGVILIRLE